jgi:large subunit ribosomal protein L25
MDEFAIVAEARTALGKGATRRLRRAGKVPAVLYGAGKESVSMQLDRDAIGKQVENEAFFSHILTVEVGDEKAQAVVKAMQRAPASGDVIHLDLQRVSSDTELTMNVPLHFMNEESCVGRRAGGVINHLALEVEITCLPGNLPEYIEVDVEALEIGSAVHLSELKMPEGVRLTAHFEEAEQDHTVVNVTEPQYLDLGEEEGEEGEEIEAEELAAAPAPEESDED